jgi:hypothetical protein
LAKKTTIQGNREIRRVPIAQILNEASFNIAQVSS